MKNYYLRTVVLLLLLLGTAATAGAYSFQVNGIYYDIVGSASAGVVSVTYKDTNDATRTVSLPIRIRIINKSANPADSRLQVLNMSRTQPSGWSLHSQQVSISSLKGYSTQSLLGDPTYIDCDLGEAYKYVDGALVSLNGYIDLGSGLPKLASGANEVTFSNTFTEVIVVPHWWKV